MAAKRKPKRAAYPAVWRDGTTLSEVVPWTATQFETNVLLFAAAYRARNDADMLDAVRHLRGVSTRLDQFRRMQARKWAMEQEAQTTGEATKA